MNEVVFFDLETTGLDAESSFIVGYGLLPLDGEFKHCFLGEVDEKQLIEKCISELSNFHVVVTWYGEGFDFPMLISRAIKHQINIQPIFKLKHLDLYKIAKRFLLLKKNNLDNVAKFLEIPKKVELTGADMPPLYMKAIQGDKEALQKAIEHCKDDLQALRQVYKRFRPILGLEERMIVEQT